MTGRAAALIPCRTTDGFADALYAAESFRQRRRKRGVLSDQQQSAGIGITANAGFNLSAPGRQHRRFRTGIQVMPILIFLEVSEG